MHVVWYALVAGERRGPMSWDELRGAVRVGAVGPQDYVWTPGYGAEWRRAATLDTLFPPPAPPPPAAAPASAARPPRAAAAEVSPFAPRRPDPRPPERGPRCLLSLRTAWANLRVVLLMPFSLARWCVFSLAALLLLLGAQPEWQLVPSALPSMRARAETLGLAPVLESRLFSFPDRWAEAVRRGVATSDPAPLLDDLGESLRDLSARAVAWTRRAPPAARATVFGGLALLLFAFAALRSWFLVRSWTFLLGRIYRRDEPLLLTWIDVRRPSGVLLRGVLPLRFAAVAVHAAVFAGTVCALARLPEGGAGRDAASAFFAAVCLPYALDALAMGFLRDFALPRVMLQGLSFGGAVRAAWRSLGTWYVRYVALLALFAGAVSFFLRPLLGLAGALFGDLPTLLLLVYAALVMPFQLLRGLWTLDLFFRLCPSARSLVPPRGLASALRRRGP